jgi:MFS family permease
MQRIINALQHARHQMISEDNNSFLKLFISKRLIGGAAAALTGIFVPIFLYETSGGVFYLVGLYYILISLLYVLLLVPGMSITNRIGFSHALVLGGAFSVVYYAAMFFLDPGNLWYVIVPLTVGIVGFRVFHWVPYHVDFTLFTRNGERGSQVGLSFAVIAFMGIIGPILAGFIISHAGYQALFGTVLVLLVATTISYSFVPETVTRFEWGWKETWQKFFSKNMRGVVLGEFASGAETVVTVVVWPIFLYEILSGDVFSVGAVSTIVVGATIVLQLLLGRHLDQVAKSKEKTLRVGSTLYALGWILKIFVLSAAQVFFIGLYHNVVKVFTVTPYNAILYDMSAEQGKYVDEFTVLREMASHSGRAISLALISILSLFIDVGWTFLIAAAASIALNLVYRINDTNG